MSETILTTGERMKASMAYKAFERAPGEYFVTRLSNGRHAGVVAGPFATPQEAWAEVDRRWAADRDAAITNDGVTTAARAAFRASKDAGNDDGCAFDDANEAIRALVGKRTGTFDQESLTWTFDT